MGMARLSSPASLLDTPCLSSSRTVGKCGPPLETWLWGQQMSKEVPVKIIPRRGKHRLETRIFARDIHETYCAQPGCKFKGGTAQQGVCHTTEPFAGGDWKYIDRLEKYAEEVVKEAKKLYKGKSYITYLEAQHVADWMNSMFILDEVVRLRRKVALLGKLGIKYA